MADSKVETYNGGCHCGAIRFNCQLPLLKQVTACNCSICYKKGILWAFPTPEDQLVVEKGEGLLKEYEFGKKTMAHKFCSTCGVSLMAERGPGYGVNVRVLDNVDVEQLDIQAYDGAAMEPAYVSPHSSKSDPTAGNYQGSCHCGKVTYGVKSQSLKDLEVAECNCSICARNGYLWIYPLTRDVQITGIEHLTTYRFNTKRAGHAFCSTCGVNVINQLDDPDGKIGLQPVNMRTVNDVNLDECKIKKVDGKSGDLSDEFSQARAAEFWEEAKRKAGGG